MILIISEHYDKVSDNVIEWLIGKAVFYRIDYQDKVLLKRIKFGVAEMTCCINHNSNDIENTTVGCCWYRRGKLNFINMPKTVIDYSAELEVDERRAISLIENILYTKKMFGSYISEIENNKLNDLRLASNVGLEIPKTIVTNCGDEVRSFGSLYSKIITKQLSADFRVEYEGDVYKTSGTRLLTREELDNIPNDFPLTMFQEYIEKYIEIRVFFFNDKFFSMAIFSQGNQATRIDYRNYDDSKPNRNVPFELPQFITEKLLEFLSTAGYNTGSIDIILTPDNRYVFLEINPTSQFHFVSQSCNYHIEKYIAETLMQFT